MSREIRLNVKNDKIVGAVRLPNDVFDKIDTIAKEFDVSKAEVVRRIVEAFIDEAKFV